MKRIEDAFEEMLIGFGRRASGRVVALVVLVVYGGVGLALPLVLGWSVPWLVAANITGSSWAGIFILLWIGGRIQEQHRRHLVEWTTDLRLLTAQEFEWLVGELFRRQGWNVAETGRQDRADGNVDLRVTRDGKTVLVQCKRWTSWVVGVDEIRAFAGTLMREGLAANSGIFVTLSNFGEPARDEAKKIGLTLLDNRDIYALVEKVRRGEACPVSGSSMLLDRSPRGWWFRCVAMGCSGKRDLGPEPARALELLTEPPGR